MSRPEAAVVLTGLISKDEDEYTLFCPELNITTTGSSFEDVVRAGEDMIIAYFEACTKLGTIDREMERLSRDHSVPLPPSAPSPSPAPDRSRPQFTLRTRFEHELEIRI